MTSSSATDKVTFRRLCILERGTLSHCPTVFPVRKLSISANGVELWTWKGSIFSPWLHTSVVVEHRKTIGYGPQHSHRKICRIKTPRGRFKFDVSHVYPDFANGERIIDALRQHVHVEETRKPTSNYAKDSDTVRSRLRAPYGARHRGR